MNKESMSLEKKIIAFTNIYYGWIIVAVALISMAFWFGIRSSFPIFKFSLHAGHAESNNSAPVFFISIGKFTLNHT